VVGCIRTPDGHAAGGLPVMLYRYDGTQWFTDKQWFSDTVVVSTDLSGAFSFHDIDTGRYLLEVRDSHGRSLIEEVILDEYNHSRTLGTFTINTMGKIEGYVDNNTGTTIGVNTEMHIYKGQIPIKARGIFNAYTIDSLPPGDYKILVFGQITRHDGIYLSVQEIIIIDSVITIPLRGAAVIDTIDINEAAIRTDDSTIIAEIEIIKNFLVKAGCKPEISASWFHPTTGHVRIIEARSTNKMPLNEAINTLTAFSGIEKIRLSGFSGTVIPETVFTFRELTELSLTDGEITSLPEGITGLNKLRFLRLNNNAIKQLPTIVLDKRISSLQSADFTGNPLQRIEWEQQQYINSLFLNGISIILTGKAYAINEDNYKALLSFFEQNGLDDRMVHTYVTTGTLASEQDAIVTLYVNDAVISVLPDDFGNLTSLRSLYIFNNTIDTLPEVFGSLANLQDLHISNGTISTLPMQLGRCTNLKTIDFTNNHIHRVPKWLGTLRSLKYADFSNNCIDTANTIIPLSCIVDQLQCNSSTPAPDSLYLSDIATVNTIVTYGNNSEPLPLMGYVQCRNNRVVLLRIVIDNEVRMAALDTLCAMAATLDSMQTLHIIMRNKAEMIPELSTVFSHLEEFIGSGGELRMLSTSFATSFPKLRRIALPGNRFDTIPAALRSLKSLSSIDLYFNHLTNLTKDDSLWLDGVSAVDRRVLWDSGFGFSYVYGMNWRESQFDPYLPQTDAFQNSDE
jgi:Leucine-rich repeat (LRR) protein